MKLILTQCRELSETEVEIRYAEMNGRIRNLSKRIEQSEQYLYGEENGRQRAFDFIGRHLYLDTYSHKAKTRRGKRTNHAYTP